jgi:formylglycine-generating enzyme required for sulfatase activity/tRNA A-37 threonylcarbamoyl transferase component Bud32
VPDLSNLQQGLDLTFAAGDRIGHRYIIQEDIGKGGMGVVYRAHDTLIDEEVALKFMRPQLLRTQKGQMVFIQEAQIARRLRHDNIVAVHDISWTNEGILYLSMEFLRGQSLRTLLRKHRQERKLIDVRFAVHVISQILEALDYAHRMVVHRDMKPENTIILPGEQVKVLDFGLAKVIDEDVSYPHDGAGKEGSRVTGTFAYASPEQKKHLPVDLRADIYSVGLVFHELLTLRTPIDTPVTVSQVRNDVSPSLLDVLKQAVHPEREGRWPSAREFQLALKRAFEQSYHHITSQVPDVPDGTVASTEDTALLEGGHFLVGCDDVKEESPEFEAQVDPFFMDKYPVTVKQYAAFLKAAGHPEPAFWGDPRYSGPNQPVIGVSWEDANAYAAWAGKKLPTEIQWEFAARGKENRVYPWGNLEPDTTKCNFGDYLSMPSNVTMHDEGKTPDGIFDLAGNVYEWTSNPFLPYDRIFAARSQVELGNERRSPQTPLRAVRGGCWDSKPAELRCTHRRGMFPETRLASLGFRCVIPAKSKTRDASRKGN